MGRRWVRGLPPRFLWPEPLARRVRRYGLADEAAKPFQRASVVWSESGYWYLDPMPGDEELDHYYKTLYWGSFRDGFGPPVNSRDVNHARILASHILDLHERSLTVVNFGAGHGGITHFLDFGGHKVIEVDPARRSPSLTSSNVSLLNSLTDIHCGADLIYCSHSLEHVNHVDEVLAHFQRLLAPGGYLFIEVPNGLYPKCGPQIGAVDVPHTYYFTRAFFDELPWLVTVSNLTCDESQDLATQRDDDGSVIQYLGKRA